MEDYRSTYILEICVDNLHYIFNRHSNSEMFNIPSIDYLYDRKYSEYIKDCGISFLEELPFTNYKRKDQRYINVVKNKWLCKIKNSVLDDANNSAVESKLNEIVTIRKTHINRLMREIKDYATSRMEHVKKLIEMTKKLWFDYYYIDHRYRDCNKIDLLKSSRLSDDEKLLFIFIRDYFDYIYSIGYKMPFKRQNFYNQMRNIMFDQLRNLYNYTK